MTSAPDPSFRREELRTLLHCSPEQLNHLAGRLAETLRRDQVYRAATAIYVEPHQCLRQIRINTLIDGKKLLMPTAGLREGFTLTRPFTVPFPSLGFAVSVKGQFEYGKKIKIVDLKGVDVGLMVAAAGLIDPDGLWLSDGKGFLDLARAVLHQSQALVVGAKIYAVPTASLAEKMPSAPWDTRINGEITVDRIIPHPGEQNDASIHWSALAEKRVKKITPLWQIRLQAAE